MWGGMAGGEGICMHSNSSTNLYVEVLHAWSGILSGGEKGREGGWGENGGGQREEERGKGRE